MNDQYIINSLFNNRFILIFLVIFLMRIKYASYRNIYVCAFVNILGTSLHELSHFFVGLLLNARPTSFSVWPKRSLEGGYTMGSVGFRNITFYNAIPSCLAPLSLLYLGYLLNKYFLPLMIPTIGNYLIYLLMQTVIIENAIPSRADISIACKFPLGILLYGALTYYIWTFIL